MCDCDCVQNPYYQDLITQRACASKGLPYIDVSVYPETMQCSPCLANRDKDNWRACGFPTWEQFDKMDCTFKGLNRTYGKLVPARLMSDVMLPGPKGWRSKKSASESKLKRIPCKKKGITRSRSDTQVGGKSKRGGGKSGHPGKSGHSDKGGRKSGGGGKHNGHGGGVSGSKSSKNSKSKKGGKHSKGKENDTIPESSLDNELVKPGTSGTGIGGSHHGSEEGSKLGSEGEYIIDENGETIYIHSLLNSGILTLTPLKERDGQYYFNFNIRNQQPNPDLNLDINVQEGIFLGDNKLTTEIRYRLEHTFDDAIQN